VLQQGQIVFNGPCKDAIQCYLQGLRVNQTASGADVIDLGSAASRPAKHRPQLKKLELFDGNRQPLGGILSAGGSLTALIHVEMEAPSVDVGVELGFFTLSGQRVCTAHSAYDPNCTRERLAGQQVFLCKIPSLPLIPGEYQINVGLDIGLREADCVEDAVRLTVVQSDYYGTGVLPTKGVFLLNGRWTAATEAARLV
jgi:lipopolysaccharide transport system ATP-binding protein